ncbi:MAG: alpha/beta hydrolase [Myxococcota bacterium]
MTVLARLQESLGSGDTHAVLRAFVEANTFPIVEDDTATFFYWDGHAADAILLRHWVFGLESAQALIRIPNTDAFALTVALPPAGRVEYKFEVQRHGGRQWIRDPLNDRRAFDPFGSNSVCPMPGYQQPKWAELDPKARLGRLTHFHLESKVWGGSRKVQVYLPYEYRSHREYPLIIAHDGSDYLRFSGFGQILDNLMTRHELLPAIVVLIDGGNRNVEFGAHPDHPRYIVEELLPAIEERFRILPGAHNRGLMGASFGAVASLWTAWNYPGVFGKLLLQSGSFVFTDVGHHGRSELWDPVVAFINTLRADPARLDAQVFMSCGTFESLIAYNRALAPLLRQAGIRLRFREASDGHNWIAWRDQLREGLTWLYPGHLWMTYD